MRRRKSKKKKRTVFDLLFPSNIPSFRSPDFLKHVNGTQNQRESSTKLISVMMLENLESH